MPGRFVDDYLSYLLARASYVIYREFAAEVKASGLSSLEWRVLASLADSDGVTIGELAAAVLAKQPTLTKLVERMVRQGLVAKRDDASDRRRTLVFGTPLGRRVVKPLLARAKAHEREALAGFAERDVRALKAILASVIERGEAPEALRKRRLAA
jgi:DNA-binding MarR family transcriptional regulator